MGYGHLRPAHALADYLRTPVFHADRPPIAVGEEERGWATMRHLYDGVSQLSAAPLVGGPFRALLDTVTAIPRLHPFRDLSSPDLPVHLLTLSARRGLGRSLVRYLSENDSALVATFYSPAILADYHQYDRIFCVVTDSDVQRVWAPAEPKHTRIHYFAPSSRVARRLRAYGVPREQIDFTGFPLPDSLVGRSRDALHRNLMSRLARLDPNSVFRRQFAAGAAALGPLPPADGPPRIVFAVGGAGAQAELPARFLPSLAPALRDERLRLTLVAGIKTEVAAGFERLLDDTGLGGELGRSVEILHATDVADYFHRFNTLLARTDVLWTKPSEITFFGGLGLPILFSPAVGRHETYNERWARENGAGLAQRDPRAAGDWLLEWLADGTLAATAWAGYQRLPNQGLYRITDRLCGSDTVPRNTLTPP
ncbi:MAG: hypothetical protein JW751_05480 [Polyangiaceae bacterium]|nr:hypothetical protein [Polyangiaceae bacterium]